MKNLFLILLALTTLGLSACQHKSQITGSAQSEKEFCAAHPDQCVVRALDQEVKP